MNKGAVFKTCCTHCARISADNTQKQLLQALRAHWDNFSARLKNRSPNSPLQ